MDAVSEATIAETFMMSLQDVKPTVNRLELIKYTCKDWRILFGTNQRESLKREVFKLV